MTIITNESGRFTVDDTGTLLEFECVEANCFKNDIRHMFSLKIPEGIHALSDHVFSGYHVNIIGIELPATLKHISKTAFSGTFIENRRDQTISLPQNADSEMIRQLAHALRFSFSWFDLTKNWPEEYSAIYHGEYEKPEAWKRITSESGEFFIDSDGILMEYHLNTRGEHAPTLYSAAEIDDLIIPEGVEAIPDGCFNGLSIQNKLYLPHMLKYIGCPAKRGTENCHRVFSRWKHTNTLANLELPPNLELLGYYAFAGRHIHTCKLPRAFGLYYMNTYARLFKESYFDELRIPIEYKAAFDAEYDVDGRKWQSLECREITDSTFGAMYSIRSDSRPIKADIYFSRFLARVAHIQQSAESKIKRGFRV